jgi:Tfp pilus assembly protein PilX
MGIPSIKRGRRGSVLLHVLVTGTLVALIAASLMRVALLRYQVTSRTVATNLERRLAEAALNTITSDWNQTGNVCSPVTIAGYSCTGTAGTCACRCTSAGKPDLVASPSPAGCKLVVDALVPGQ